MGMIEIPDPADLPADLKPAASAVNPEFVPSIPDVDPDILPKVELWRLMILPVTIPEATQSGILLSADTVKHRELLRTVGKVVGMGPLAYTGPRFAGLAEPPIQVGDWVAYYSYNGVEIRIHDRTGRPCSLRFINDDEILGRVPNPQALMVMI